MQTRSAFDPFLTDVVCKAFDDTWKLLTVANAAYATRDGKLDDRNELAHWMLDHAHLANDGVAPFTARALDEFCRRFG